MINEGEALQETTSDLIPTCEYVNLYKKKLLINQENTRKWK